MSKENVEVAKSYFEAGSRGNLAALPELMDPEIEVHDSIEVPDASTYYGIDGFLKALARFRKAWSEDARHEPIELIDVSDELVLAVIHSTGKGRASGAPVEATWAQLFTIRNHKIVLLRSFLDKGQALEAAGLSE